MSKELDQMKATLNEQNTKIQAKLGEELTHKIEERIQRNMVDFQTDMNEREHH